MIADIGQSHAHSSSSVRHGPLELRKALPSARRCCGSNELRVAARGSGSRGSVGDALTRSRSPGQEGASPVAAAARRLSARCATVVALTTAQAPRASDQRTHAPAAEGANDGRGRAAPVPLAAVEAPAAGDMVGHTGVMEAAIKACEAVDQCVKDVVTTALDNQYTTILIADHGNCETMINPDGTPHTAHTTNPVPFILIDNDKIEVKDGVLGDIAPTILDLMGINKPDAMNQNTLINSTVSDIK